MIKRTTLRFETDNSGFVLGDEQVKNYKVIATVDYMLTLESITVYDLQIDIWEENSPVFEDQISKSLYKFIWAEAMERAIHHASEVGYEL